MITESHSNTSIQFANLQSNQTEYERYEHEPLFFGKTVQYNAPHAHTSYIDEKLAFERTFFEKHIKQFRKLNDGDKNQICSYLQLINQIIGNDAT